MYYYIRMCFKCFYTADNVKLEDLSITKKLFKKLQKKSLKITNVNSILALDLEAFTKFFRIHQLGTMNVNKTFFLSIPNCTVDIEIFYSK